MTPHAFGRYEIRREIGRGGMATVYHAYDPRFKRDVALKVLPREFVHDPTFRARFEREAQTIAALEHSAIVPVYDFGEEAGQPYLVMRYMAGGSLADRIRQEYLPLDDVFTIIERIASALDSAHRREVIHRDVKPANILFDQEGDAFLTDFGIVKLTETAAKLTGSGIVGTPAYVAPEMSKPGGVSPLIDVYALGVTLFQMLTCRLPYEADTPIGMLMAHAIEPIPNVREVRPDLPEAIRTVVERALAKDPLDRYPSAGECAADLKSAVAGVPISAPATPLAHPTPLDAIAIDEMRTIPAESETPPAQPLQAPAIETEPRRGMPGWRWVAIGGGIAACLAVGAVLIVTTGVIEIGPRPSVAGETPAVEPAESQPVDAMEEAPAVAEEPAGFSVGLVTDTGGINDQSFNRGAWEGLERVGADLGIEVSYLESRDGNDYQPNIQQYIDQGTDLIITVGYLLAEDTGAAAEANPDTNFAIVDTASMAPNVMGIEFATDETAFLAGYLAAGMSETGAVGIFGGWPTPQVLRFMVGFEQGVSRYNEVHGAHIRVFGWDGSASTGLFTHDFQSPENGHLLGGELIAQGADIILPVAGPTGLGTIDAAHENPGVMVIWVDTDGCVVVPDGCDVILTTVVKETATAVSLATEAAYHGEFAGGTSYMGTLANGGVSLAPFHEFEDDVPADLANELADVRQAIIDGSITTGWDDFVASGGLDQ